MNKFLEGNDDENIARLEQEDFGQGRAAADLEEDKDYEQVDERHQLFNNLEA